MGPVLAVAQLVTTNDALVPGVQEATPVGPLVTVLQVVAVYKFPEEADAGVHEAAGVGPVVTVLQVVAV